ncbi:MAG: polyprenol phosphomannose-dependent alpha 1,6 mannosyltransferase MptB, partial [Acidimicrobiales bacterium]
RRQRVRELLLGPPPGEEVTPYVPVAEPARPAGPLVTVAAFVLCALGGLIGAVLIVASAPVWYLAEPSWRLTVPGIPHPGTSFQATSTFILGLVFMALAWIGLIGRAERAPISHRSRLVAVVLVGLVWCVPVLLGPPMLSHDVYSYASQGEMASRGIDPTANGPFAMKNTRWVWQVDPIWRNAPAPYGPVAVEAGKVVVDVTGHDPASAIWGFRALAMLGVMLGAVGVASIARSMKQSAALAVAVGIASPLVLLHLIGGSHNDALMMGLLAVGVAAFLRKRKWLGMALVILATGAKVPAAAGIVFLAWNWLDDPETSIWQRVKTTALAGVGSMAAISVLSVLVGIQVGWMAALKSTGSVYSTFSVSTKLGFLTASGLQTLGLHVSSDGTVALFRLVGIALAGVICTVLLLRSPRIGMARALGISMIVVVLLSPVVWPWYLAAGFALVAASGMGKWRPTYVVLIIAGSAVVFPTSIAPVKSLNPYQHLLTMAVVVLIAIACYLAQKLAAYLAARRERLAPAATRDRSLDAPVLATLH